jgi:hypothetical protein
MAAWRRLAPLVICAIACSAGACSTGSSARPKVTYTAAEGAEQTPPDGSPEQAERPRKKVANVENVEIRALGAPERAHVIVGRLVVREDDDDRLERDRLMQALRSRAAELGCDAVLLEPPFEEQKRVRFRFDYLIMTRPVLHGACIVYE